MFIVMSHESFQCSGLAHFRRKCVASHHLGSSHKGWGAATEKTGRFLPCRWIEKDVWPSFLQMDVASACTCTSIIWLRFEGFRWQVSRLWWSGREVTACQAGICCLHRISLFGFLEQNKDEFHWSHSFQGFRLAAYVSHLDSCKGPLHRNCW